MDLAASPDLSELIERFVAAWERNDVDAVVSVLAEDVRMTMPPLPSWYSGREQVAAFLRGFALAEIKRWQLIPTSANGQPTLAGYLWHENAEAFMPYCLYVLTLREGQIEAVTAFVTPETFQRFGPARLDRRINHPDLTLTWSPLFRKGRGAS
jgi:RNA polymerase sigma-70 factor (ECF subfamily)